MLHSWLCQALLLLALVAAAEPVNDALQRRLHPASWRSVPFGHQHLTGQPRRLTEHTGTYDIDCVQSSITYNSSSAVNGTCSLETILQFISGSLDKINKCRTPDQSQVVPVYIMPSPATPEYLDGVEAYRREGRGWAVQVTLTPALDTTEQIVDWQGRAYTDHAGVLWDNNWFYYTGYDLTYTDLQVVENQYQSQKTPVGLLYPRTYYMLAYRRDWFAAANVAPPTTWAELEHLAADSSLWVAAAAAAAAANVDRSTGSGAPVSAADGNSTSSTGGSVSSSSGTSRRRAMQQAEGEAEAGNGPQAGNSTDGSGIWGLCLTLEPACSGSYALMAIYASIAQTKGLSQGTHFDPFTLAPLVSSPGMAAAMRQFLSLVKHAAPSTNGSCPVLHPAFLEGRCAMTLTFDTYYRFMFGASNITGRIGWAPAPGSDVVWDRSSPDASAQSIKVCAGSQEEAEASNGTYAYCPYAQRTSTGGLVNRGVLSNIHYYYAGASYDFDVYVQAEQVIVADSCIRHGNEYQRKRQLVSDAMLQLVQPHADVVSKGTADATGNSTSSDESATGPRTFLVFPKTGEAPPAVNLSAWADYAAAASSDPGDSESYFTALWQAKWHPNQAADLAIFNVEFARAAYFAAVQRLLDEGLNASSPIMDQLAARYSVALYAVAGAVVDPVSLYRTTLNFTLPPAPPPPAFTAPAVEQSGLSDQARAAVIAVPSVLVPVLLLLALILLVAHQRSKHRGLFGRVLAPGHGPETSIIITDIEDSTALWELLSPEVMDRTIKLHHACVRSCLLACNVYECATEGDAFVLAAHSAHDAVLVSALIHRKLMACDWPAPVLDLPLCRPVWVIPKVSSSAPAAGPATGAGALPDAWDATPRSPVAHSDHQHRVSPAARLFRKMARCMRSLRPKHRFSDLRTLSGTSTNSSSSVEQSDSSVWDPFARVVATSAYAAPMPEYGMMSRLLVDRSMGGYDQSTLQTETDQGVRRVDSIGIGWGDDMDAGFIFSWPGREGSEPNSPRGGNASMLTGRASGQWVRGGTSPYAQTDPASDPTGPGMTGSPAHRISDMSGLNIPFNFGGGSLSLPNASVLSHLASSILLSYTEPRSMPGPAGKHPPYLLLRGLRLRIGIASGVPSSQEITYSKASGRWQYSGTTMEAARALSHACPGGVVVLHQSTFQMLPLEQLQHKHLIIAHMGQFDLREDNQKADIPLARMASLASKAQSDASSDMSSVEDGAAQLYTSSDPRLLYRFVLACPMRGVIRLEPSFLDAPFVTSAISFLHVVGVQSLLAWDVSTTRQALRLLGGILREQLLQHGGYLVELTDGLVLTAFAHPHTAIRWALTTIQECLVAAWPDELLEHELGEEISLGVPKGAKSFTAAASLAAVKARQRLLKQRAAKDKAAEREKGRENSKSTLSRGNAGPAAGLGPGSTGGGGRSGGEAALRNVDSPIAANSSSNAIAGMDVGEEGVQRTSAFSAAVSSAASAMVHGTSIDGSSMPGPSKQAAEAADGTQARAAPADEKEVKHASIPRVRIIAPDSPDAAAATSAKAAAAAAATADQSTAGVHAAPDSARAAAAEAAPEHSAAVSRQLKADAKLLFRGLRMKGGVDYGEVSATVHAVLARITYRGRVMNRASRISSVAKTGQVVCSETAWVAGCMAMSTSSTDGDRLSAHNSGTHGGAHSVASNASRDSLRLLSAAPQTPGSGMRSPRLFFKDMVASIGNVRSALGGRAASVKPLSQPLFDVTGAAAERAAQAADQHGLAGPQFFRYSMPIQLVTAASDASSQPDGRGLGLHGRQGSGRPSSGELAVNVGPGRVLHPSGSQVRAALHVRSVGHAVTASPSKPNSLSQLQQGGGSGSELMQLTSPSETGSVAGYSVHNQLQGSTASWARPPHSPRMAHALSQGSLLEHAPASPMHMSSPGALPSVEEGVLMPPARLVLQAAQAGAEDVTDGVTPRLMHGSHLASGTLGPAASLSTGSDAAVQDLGGSVHGSSPNGSQAAMRIVARPMLQIPNLGCSPYPALVSGGTDGSHGGTDGSQRDAEPRSPNGTGSFRHAVTVPQSMSRLSSSRGGAPSSTAGNNPGAAAAPLTFGYMLQEGGQGEAGSTGGSSSVVQGASGESAVNVRTPTLSISAAGSAAAGAVGSGAAPTTSAPAPASAQHGHNGVLLLLSPTGAPSPGAGAAAGAAWARDHMLAHPGTQPGSTTAGPAAQHELASSEDQASPDATQPSKLSIQDFPVVSTGGAASMTLDSMGPNALSSITNATLTSIVIASTSTEGARVGSWEPRTGGHAQSQPLTPHEPQPQLQPQTQLQPQQHAQQQPQLPPAAQTAIDAVDLRPGEASDVPQPLRLASRPTSQAGIALFQRIASLDPSLGIRPAPAGPNLPSLFTGPGSGGGHKSGGGMPWDSGSPRLVPSRPTSGPLAPGQAAGSPTADSSSCAPGVLPETLRYEAVHSGPHSAAVHASGMQSGPMCRPPSGMLRPAYTGQGRPGGPQPASQDTTGLGYTADITGGSQGVVLPHPLAAAAVQVSGAATRSAWAHEPIIVIPLGPHTLKGLQHPINLLLCKFECKEQ